MERSIPWRTLLTTYVIEKCHCRALLTCLQTWEHYSSIRNIDGPHTGLPSLHPKPLSPEEEAKNKEEAAKIWRVLPWMIDVVHSTLPYAANKEAIIKALEQSKCNIDVAVNVLLDREERGSSSSQTGSSSTERDPDSDDEDLDAPNKKQDRRMSRATRAMKKDKASKTTAAGNIASDADTASDSAANIKKSASPRRRLVPRSRLNMKKEQEDGWVFVASENNDDADRSSIEIIDESDLSGISRSASLVPEQQDGLSLRPKNNIKLIVKPKSEASSSQPVRVPARQKADLKKAAQKAAQKEKKKTAAQTSRVVETVQCQSSTSTPSPPNSIGQGIKTLYI